MKHKLTKTMMVAGLLSVFSAFYLAADENRLISRPFKELPAAEKVYNMYSDNIGELVSVSDFYLTTGDANRVEVDSLVNNYQTINEKIDSFKASNEYQSNFVENEQALKKSYDIAKKVDKWAPRTFIGGLLLLMAGLIGYGSWEEHERNKGDEK